MYRHLTGARPLSSQPIVMLRYSDAYQEDFLLPALSMSFKIDLTQMYYMIISISSIIEL